MAADSKKDPMYGVYGPRVIAKDSLLTASRAELEMLLPHVVLVKDPVVPAMFTPRRVHLFYIMPYTPSWFRTSRPTASGNDVGDDHEVHLVGKDGVTKPSVPFIHVYDMFLYFHAYF